MTRRIAVLSAALLLLFCVPPALGVPDAVSYEQYVTLIHDQDGEGDCIGYSATHVLEIQKEMERSYSPDPSFSFMMYVFRVKTAGGFDPRVIQPGGTWETILSNYGLPPETSFPTNFDAIGSALDPPTLFSHPPSDTAFTEAQAYRLGGQVESLYSPSIAQTEDWLATKGPLVCHSLFKDHTVALIGYDRNGASGSGEFTIIDSANYLGIGTAAIKRVPYALYASRKPNMTIQYAPNVETPLVHPYTARIRVSHADRRSLLTVKIGAEGHDPVTVWDRNNRVNRSDWGSNLAIDVPLPAYAAEHWPPSDQNRWYVEVTNHDSDHSAELREVTLVQRLANPDPLPDAVYPYPQPGLPLTIGPGTARIGFPRSLTITSPNGGEQWAGGERRTIRFLQVGLPGTNVRIDLLQGTTPVLEISSSWPAEAGSIDWYVPTTLPHRSDYFVRVQSLSDPRISDRSDAPLGVNPRWADFAANPVSGPCPLPVKFIDSSTGEPTAWLWDFGDGQTSTTRSPSHSYSSAGTYSVTLTVTYPDGETRTVKRSNLVKVYQSLRAVFEPSAVAGYEPLTVRFTDTTTGNPTSWHWDFGDGKSSTEQHPTHTYQGALSGEALYTVVLTVSNPYDTKTATNDIRVFPLYSGKVLIEAEDYDPGGENVSYHDLTFGNSGGVYRSDDVDIVPSGSGGYVVSNIQNSEWTQYTVLNPGLENATVPFSIRAASSYYYNYVRVFVNGQQRGTHQVPYTTSLSTFGSSSSSLTLKPGWNTIRFEYLSSVSSSTMSIDYFTLDISAVPVASAAFRFSPSSIPMVAGQTNETALYLHGLGRGLSGFNVTLALSNPSVAEIVGVTVPGYSHVRSSSLPADVVWISAADTADLVGPDDNALIGTVTVRGDARGSGELRVTGGQVDDDYGGGVAFQTASCRVPVAPAPSLPPPPTPNPVVIVPGGIGMPTDPNADGIDDDVNGNGRADFADIVLYFNQMTWIAANEPVGFFDCNGNGRIDFADVVWLFNDL